MLQELSTGCHWDSGIALPWAVISQETRAKRDSGAYKIRSVGQRRTGFDWSEGWDEGVEWGWGWGWWKGNVSWLLKISCAWEKWEWLYPESHRLRLKFVSCLCCVAGVAIKYFSFDIHGKALHCSSLSIHLLPLSILSYVSTHLACSATGCLWTATIRLQWKP